MESQGGVRSTRWRVEAAIAVLFAVVMLVVGGGAAWVMSTSGSPFTRMPPRCRRRRPPRAPTGMRAP